MSEDHTMSCPPRANQVSTRETGTILLISNLDYVVSNEDIKDIFSEVGDLKRYSIYYDKSGRSKGMAEVVFSRSKDAKAAVKRYNNAQLNGKPMKIEIVGTIAATSTVITPPNGTSGYQSGAPRRTELLILRKPIHAVAMEEFEKREDCFVLDFDPYDTLDISKLSIAKGAINADSSDICVVAEKGQKKKHAKGGEPATLNRGKGAQDHNSCTGPSLLSPNRTINRTTLYFKKKVQEPESKQQYNMFEDHTMSCPPRANQVSTRETGTILLISNLDYVVSNEDIKDIFSEVGDLKRYSIYYDKSGRSKGMAEVVFSRSKDAKAAVKRYNNAQLNGKPMKIEIVGTIAATSSVITPPNGTSGYQSGAPRRTELLILRKPIHAVAMEEFEKREDCFVLDFDPYDTLDISKLSIAKGAINADSSDICVVAEKGQVACRDFPHSRHSCVRYPFEKTNHESCCRLCYCFVCDIAAPCRKWTGLSGHCHAINSEGWRFRRLVCRSSKKPKK